MTELALEITAELKMKNGVISVTGVRVLNSHGRDLTGIFKEFFQSHSIPLNNVSDLEMCAGNFFEHFRDNGEILP